MMTLTGIYLSWILNTKIYPNKILIFNIQYRSNISKDLMMARKSKYRKLIVKQSSTIRSNNSNIQFNGFEDSYHRRTSKEWRKFRD